MRKVSLILACILLYGLTAASQEVYGTVQLLDSFAGAGGWRAAGDHQGPLTGMRAVDSPSVAGTAAELVYDFIGSAGTLNYCEYIKQLTIPQEATHLGFWVRGDGSGHALRVRVLDAEDEWLQYTVGSLNFTAWTQVYVDLERPDGSWGGDGAVDWPLRFNSFVIDSKSRSFVGSGSIYVDELAAAVALAPSPLDEGFEDDPASWQATAESGAAEVAASDFRFSGSRSLRVAYSGLNAGSALHLKPRYPLPILGAPLVMSLRLYGAAENCLFRLADGAGEEIVLELGGVFPGQWQLLESAWQELTETRQITLPLSLLELIVYPAGGADAIYLDQLSAKSLLGSVQTGSYLQGEEVKLNYSLEYEGSAAAKVKLQARKGGEVVYECEKDVQSSSGTLALGKLAQGSYAFEAWCLCGRAEFLLRREYFSVLPPLQSGNEFVGVQTHYAQGKGKLPDNLLLAVKAGAGFIRDELYWSSIEKQPGEFSFPAAYDAYLNEAVRLGLKPLVILDYGNGLYGGGAPVTEAQLVAWRGYVRAVVRRYPQVKHWEIWNEYNGGMGLSDQQKQWTKREKAQHYTALLEEAAKEIRQLDSSATIVGCATAGVDLEFIGAVLDYGGLEWMDAVSIHPYCYPTSPEDADLLGRVRSVRDLVAAKGGTQPVWITEIGWPTHKTQRGVDEDTQAAYLARMYTLLAASGMAEKIFWYDLHDDGVDPDYNEHNFGLVRYDYSLKSGYTALGVISRGLWQVSGPRQLSAGQGGLWHYAFASPQGEVQILWSTGDSLSYRLPEGRYSLSRLNGETVEREQGYLTLTGSPLIVRKIAASAPQTGVKVTLNANPLPLRQPLTLTVEAAERLENVSLRIYNLAGKEVGRLEERPHAQQTELVWQGKPERGAYVLWLRIRLATGEAVEKRELLLIL